MRGPYCLIDDTSVSSEDRETRLGTWVPLCAEGKGEGREGGMVRERERVRESVCQ